MDWDVPEFRELTIDVEFVKAQKKLFRITTWVPFVGCLTGMRFHHPNSQDGYSVSLNYRKCTIDKVHLMRNIMAGFTSCWPLEFLIRNVLENYSTFDDAVKVFTKSSVMAPCYLIIAGIEKNQAVQIQRTRLRDVNRLTFDGLVQETFDFKKRHDENDPHKTRHSNGKIKYLLQTNCDHWKNMIEKKWAAGDPLLLNAMDRRIVAEYCLDQYLNWSAAQEEVTKAKEDQKEVAPHMNPLVQRAFQVLSMFPVINQDTTYQCIMQPATNTYIARVSYDIPVWKALEQNK